MTASISFHGPYTYQLRHYPAATVEGHPEQYATLSIGDPGDSRVTLYFHGPDGLDGLVKAALAARDLLAPPGPTVPDAADSTVPFASGSPDAPPPPATNCPICGGKLNGNGEHATRSGARIPAGVA